jgi:anaerobic selenocysteine-containing dehydrogenase
VFDYQDYLDTIDEQAYHKGQWRWEEDGCTVTRTYHYSAPGCHDSCGVLLYTKDNEVVRVEGDPFDPYANGRLCMRCLDLPEMTNHPDRLKYPMKRPREDRGKDNWQRVSWEEALDIVEAEIKKLEDQGLGRESILVNHGTGRNINWQLPFLAAACLGTANVGAAFSSGFACYLPRICGTTAPMGDYPLVDCTQTSPERYLRKDWVNPEILVIWGNEPLKSNADGFFGHWLMQSVQMGTRIISIDPVLTWWGARAELWLPIRPGTDAAMALAWLNVITQEDLIDHEFVERWCAYYDELKAHVAQFPPEWAEPICGVDAGDIRAAARLYAQARPGTIQWGLAMDTQIPAMEVCLAVTDLLAICGNIDKPGATILVHNAFEINAGYGTSELYCDPRVWDAKLTTKKIGIPGEDFIGMACSDAISIAIEKGQPYPIKMMWTQSSNGLGGACPAAPREYKVLREALDFIVVADPFMTPMAMALADLVLPVSMSVERDSARTWWTPLRAMKAVTRYHEAKSDEEIALWLGKRLNPELFTQWDSVEDLINCYLHTDLAVVDENGRVRKSAFSATADNEEAGIVHDMDAGNIYSKFHGVGDFKSLVEGGALFDDWNQEYFKYEKGMLRPDGQLGFNTPSGRIELIPPLYERWGIDPYPTHYESAMAKQWLADEEFRKEYPLVFINGSRSYEFFHSEHKQAPTMREFHPDPIVKINPELAAEHGIKDGDWVWMENPNGRCKQKAQLFAGIDRRFVSCEHGWWFPEEEGAEPTLFRTFDSNPNNLLMCYETGSAGVGAPAKGLFCKIYKVQEGDVSPTEQVVLHGGFREYEPGMP